MSSTIVILGDLMLGRGVNEKIGRMSDAWFWGDTAEILHSADTVIANLECAITAHTRPWLRTPKSFHFGAGPGAPGVLKAGGVRFVSLANNHTLDYEVEGLLDTLDYLDEAGIAHAGAGRTQQDAAAGTIIPAGSLQIGVISATDNEPGFAAGPDRPGTNYTPIDTSEATMGTLAAATADLRRKGADLVILSMHWGPNLVMRPPEYFQRFAQKAIDHGVDLLHGHSAHVFQGVEAYHGGLILYDTGDFLDDYAVDPERRNDWSFIFCVDADAHRIQRLRMIPVRLHFARVELANEEEYAAICGRMVAQSDEFGSEPMLTEDGLEILVGHEAEMST